MAKKKPSIEEKEDMDRKARWGCGYCSKKQSGSWG